MENNKSRFAAYDEDVEKEFKNLISMFLVMLHFCFSPIIKHLLRVCSFNIKIITFVVHIAVQYERAHVIILILNSQTLNKCLILAVCEFNINITT